MDFEIFLLRFISQNTLYSFCLKKKWLPTFFKNILSNPFIGFNSTSFSLKTVFFKCLISNTIYVWLKTFRLPITVIISEGMEIKYVTCKPGKIHLKFNQRFCGKHFSKSLQNNNIFFFLGKFFLDVSKQYVKWF